MKEIDYLNSLDVWIVSHGGCGSNYIVDLLDENGYKVRDAPRKSAVLYGLTCHLAYIPKNINTKILYVYGDIINSMCSQKNRNLLKINIEKLKKGHKNKDDKDPYNYLFQYNKFFNDERVVKLKYPFTEESLNEALKELNINLKKKPVVKKRTRVYNKPYQKEIEDVYKYYSDSVLK